jgi:hypothetical protein
MNDVQLDTLRRLHDQAAQHYREHPWRPWLPADATDALLACVGAGPWRFQRRQAVQGAALNRRQELGWSLVDLYGQNLFPLAWQNQIVDRISSCLADMDFTWPGYLGTISSVDDIQAVAGGRRRFKVIDMFARDYLEIPAFPIDRHVAAQLVEHGLPVDHAAMLAGCRQVGIDPIPLARWLGSTRLDGGNPDWSWWPDRS